MAREIYYVPIGKINYAWRAESAKYGEIATNLGIKKATSSTKDLVFGANKPKPARIRLQLEPRGSNDCPGSQTVFCAPSKLESVLTGNALANKKSNGRKIIGVGLIGVRG